nr:SWIM zinc finger family protein [Lysobacter sp.]
MLTTPIPSFDLSAALESQHWLPQFSQTSIQRARRYAHGSAVSALRLHWLDSDTLILDALVQGTARKPYRTEVEVFAIGDSFGYMGDCSCPVGVDCKHAAALLMAASSLSSIDPVAAAARAGPSQVAAQRRKPAQATPAAPAWRQWLGSLGLADTAIVPAPA